MGPALYQCQTPLWSLTLALGAVGQCYASTAWPLSTSSVVGLGPSAGHLGVIPGTSKYQSFWEFFTLVLALILWADAYTDCSLSVLGDSTSALQDALNLSGRREMVALAREVAWRQIRGRWQFRVGHLPAEHNLFADALSRRFAPVPVAFPDALAAAREVSAAEPMHIWRAAIHFGLS